MSLSEKMQSMRSTVESKRSLLNTSNASDITERLEERDGLMVIHENLPPWDKRDHRTGEILAHYDERDRYYAFGYVRRPDGEWFCRTVIRTEHVTDDMVVTLEDGDLSAVLVEDDVPAISMWVRHHVPQGNMSAEQYTRHLEEMIEHAEAQISSIVLGGSPVGGEVLLGQKRFDFRCMDKARVWLADVREYRMVGVEYAMKADDKDTEAKSVGKSSTPWWARRKSKYTRGFVNGR